MMKKVFSIILIIVFVFSFALLVFSIVYSHNNDLSLFGYRLYYVESGSMEPVIKTGSVIAVKKCDYSDIQIGDTITFISKDSIIYGKVNTHKVVDIDDEGLTTQGVANPLPDETKVDKDSLLGVVRFKSAFIGKIFSLMQNRVLSFCVTIVPLLIIFLIYFVEFVVALHKPGQNDS